VRCSDGTLQDRRMVRRASLQRKEHMTTLECLLTEVEDPVVGRHGAVALRWMVGVSTGPVALR
jgi:hypothetical protein